MRRRSFLIAGGTAGAAVALGIGPAVAQHPGPSLARLPRAPSSPEPFASLHGAIQSAVNEAFTLG